MAEKKNKGGRPPEIAPEVVQTIKEALLAGSYVETAAALAGISKDTFYRWLRRGAAEKKRREAQPLEGFTRKAERDKELTRRAAEQEYMEFSDAIKLAQAQAEQRALIVISNAATGGAPVKRESIEKTDAKGAKTVIKREEYTQPAWQAAAWLLERKFPEKFGVLRRVQVDVRQAVDAELDAAIAALEEGLEPDEFARVLEILGALSGTAGEPDRPGGTP